MDNRELLEMAAKAAGIAGKWTDHYCGDYYSEYNGIRGIIVRNEVGNDSVWNPLEDDGDCARMEAKLKLNVEWCGSHVMATASEGSERCSEHFIGYEDDQAARRMASLRVAAEIGRKM